MARVFVIPGTNQQATIDGCHCLSEQQSENNYIEFNYIAIYYREIIYDNTYLATQ